jgi:hypothetical protein
MIRRAVNEATAEDSPLKAQRSTLASALSKALSSDPQWQDRYRATGKLDIPVQSAEPADSTKCLERVREVSALMSPSFALTYLFRQMLRTELVESEEGNWREMSIPVDVPPMNVRQLVTETRCPYLTSGCRSLRRPASAFCRRRFPQIARWTPRLSTPTPCRYAQVSLSPQSCLSIRLSTGARTATARHSACASTWRSWCMTG